MAALTSARVYTATSGTSTGKRSLPAKLTLVTIRAPSSTNSVRKSRSSVVSEFGVGDSRWPCGDMIGSLRCPVVDTNVNTHEIYTYTF